MSNLYYDAEKFGLEPVGEVDYSDGCYQFDYAVLWRRKADGQLLLGFDSGCSCSCPCPFENMGMDDLIPITGPADLKEHLTADGRFWSDSERDRAMGDVVDLISKVAMSK